MKHTEQMESKKFIPPMQQYELETGKSPWRIKHMYHTEEYVSWLKTVYLSDNSNPAVVAIKNFSKTMKDGK